MILNGQFLAGSSTNAVKISSTSELVNLSSFISSVGGNLLSTLAMRLRVRNES